MPFLLTAIVTLFVSVMASSPALAECLVASPPPKLVPCKTEATCDRNPEHLIKYVEQFYAWYISSEEEWMDADECSTKPQTEKESSKLYGFIQDTIEQNLTARFRAYRDQSTSEHAVWDHDFCPTESDYLICAQDWNVEEWVPRVPVQIVKMDKAEAVLLTHKISNYQLLITLKPENGAWRFDSVRDPSL
jgi:hypothetical protein